MIASLYEKDRHHLRVLMNTAFLWVKEVHFRKLATSVTFKKRMVRRWGVHTVIKTFIQFISSVAHIEKEQKPKRI